jgi:recombination protein RecA
MKEADRQRSIRTQVARLETRPVPPLPTGFPQLDIAIGGGLPRGSIVEIFGPAGCGKTTLALRIAAHIQHVGGGAAWIDAEHAFNAALAIRCGVAIEHLPVAQPESAEQALEIVRRLAASAAVELVVVDSAAALVPEVELETAVGHSGHGLQNRVLASGLRRLAGELRRTGAVVLFLNQARGNDEYETSAGGPALKLFAALRLALRRAPDTRADLEMDVEVRFRVLKNKAGDAFIDGAISWEEGPGLAESP